jgi:hypothetical protein
MCDLHHFVPDSLSPMFRYLRKPFPTKQPNRPDSGTEDMWNPESPFHASTSGDFVFDIPNQPIALSPPLTNHQSSAAGRAENGHFGSLRRGENPLPPPAVSCVRALRQRANVGDTPARTGGKCSCIAPGTTSRAKEIFATLTACMRQSMVVTVFFFFPSNNVLVGKGEGRFWHSPVKLGSIAYCGSSKCPASPPRRQG